MSRDKNKNNKDVKKDNFVKDNTGENSYPEFEEKVEKQSKSKQK